MGIGKNWFLKLSQLTNKYIQKYRRIKLLNGETVGGREIPYQYLSLVCDIPCWFGVPKDFNQPHEEDEVD